MIILLKGLTPIPYKLVTITSGFAGYNIWLFILCSIVARGGRFFVLAVLLNRYGDFIRAELEKRLTTWVVIGAIVLVGGFYIAFDWSSAGACGLAVARAPGVTKGLAHARADRSSSRNSRRRRGGALSMLLAAQTAWAQNAAPPSLGLQSPRTAVAPQPPSSSAEQPPPARRKIRA